MDSDRQSSDPLPHQPVPRETRRVFLVRAAAGMFGLACAPAVLGAAPGGNEGELVEAALPGQAWAKPLKPRKLLIFDRNVNYGGHASIPTANLAFELMGRKTGAFETVVSRDPEVFRPESLRQFDGVFFNNCVGNLFTDVALRQSLVDFVYRGGGMMGVHGTSVAFTQWPGAVEDWPEFGLMIGARGANHRASDEHVFIRMDDPTHPVNRVFGGQGFDYRDEFFRVHDPYSRKRLRVLLSIDTDKTDLKQGRGGTPLERADDDFALAWVRSYGRGRTFYCTIAHNPQVFRDRRMLSFYLAAAQFILGDLPAPTIPSALLTPALRAQEKLRWRAGLDGSALADLTLFQAADKASALGLAFLGSRSSQHVSDGIPRGFGPGLSEEELRQVRFKLDAASVRLLVHEVEGAPEGEEGWRKVFDFARKMGIETLVAAPPPEAIAMLEKLCDTYDISLALRDPSEGAASPYADPAAICRACSGRSKRLGACFYLNHWMLPERDPLKAVRQLKGRVFLVRVPGVDQQALVEMSRFFKELGQRGVRPTMIGLGGGADSPAPAADLEQCVSFLNEIALGLAGER